MHPFDRLLPPLRPLLAVLLCLAHAAFAASPLVVAGTSDLPLWPATSLRTDPGLNLSLEQVVAQPQHFAPHTGTPGNLGRSADAVWLHMPLQVQGADPVQRVLEIDYPPLNRVDVYLLQQGRVVAQHRLGNELLYHQRPLPTRTHAAPLTLAPGANELFLRVQTSSSMVLPITLRAPASFAARESQAGLLQGVLAGLALCMLLYSLANWIALRDRLFLMYALMVGGNAVFFLSYFGVGAQMLWPDAPHLSQQIAPLAVLVAVFGGTSFMNTTLAVHEVSRGTSLFLRGIGLLALAGLAAALTGIIDYRMVQSLATAVGLLSTGAVLPVTVVRARRGERVAAYMAVGWTFYVVGALCIAGLLRGYLEPTFWVQHLYPLASMMEMAVWMAVLGMRVQDIHRAADRARVETEALRALAHTDALTGLPNRRGLQSRLGAALVSCQPQQLLAVYLLDLDGFKSVNDRYGHDVGDALLMAVGQRVQAQLRGSDVVARLGGDEFVVLASGLHDESAAHLLGQKLLAAFEHPFNAGGQSCEVGLTVGYALAPLDGTQSEDLIKRADAAMYAGKQAGRRRVQRGGRSMAAATA